MELQEDGGEYIASIRCAYDAIVMNDNILLLFFFIIRIFADGFPYKISYPLTFCFFLYY